MYTFNKYIMLPMSFTDKNDVLHVQLRKPILLLALMATNSIVNNEKIIFILLQILKCRFPIKMISTLFQVLTLQVYY